MPRSSTIRVGLPLLTVALVGCAPVLPVSPAPHAADPRCAAVMLAMPDTVGGLERRGTTSQATDAWGAEYPIVVRCGVDVPGPTTDTCVTITTTGYTADWVIRDDGDRWVATTYGRNPAVEAIVPKIRVDAAVDDVLTELTPPASQAPSTGRACVGLADASPAPSASP